jgi:uncharacterized RDD family membrane protein YckC
MKDEYGNVEITYGMLASKSKRFCNYIIDYFITFSIALVAFKINLMYEDNNNLVTVEAWAKVLNSLPFQMYNYASIIIYYGLVESLSAHTLGKYVTGTKVITRDGSKPDSTAILIRTLCRLIPFEFISFFMPRPIGWHDILSKTLVVDTFNYDTAVRLNKQAKQAKEEDQ